MNREGFWKTKYETPRAAPLFIGLIAASLASASLAADQQVILPTAQQLVIMSIPDRLALFQSMQSLPPNQRDANLKTLRTEINSLSPGQKEEMRQHFQSEFNAMPQSRQAEIMQQLSAVEPH